MAEAALSMAVETLGNLLIQKVGFLRGVEDQVKWLKTELERMQCFLKDAAEKQSNDQRIRQWVAEIRDVAQDAEDVIEIFNLKIESPRRTRGLLEKCFCCPNHVYYLDRLGQDIESIRARVNDISVSRERYGIRDLGPEGAESSRRSNIALQKRRLLHQLTDKHLVGLKKEVDSLLAEAIFYDRSGLSIASITGMGGLGKSTLAREVYNHADVVNSFDCCAWVVVSEEFDPKQVLKQLMLQLMVGGEVGEDMEKLPVEELQKKLSGSLTGRRYFIVLDDVWEQQHWESLSGVFPKEEGKKSRLLVTSRKRKVPRTAQHAKELEPLDDDMSWQLFLKKSFIDDTNGKCPPELEKIGKAIVSKCCGLPLAITVMGGLLLELKQSRIRWERVLKGMNSILGRSENRVFDTLELSYHNLPPRLKSCFLCLGFFKEDAVILAEKLIQVWIAEGLISQEEGEEETMEEIARGYLDELVTRNIVQVKDIRKDDQVKSCHVHDLVRDLSIKKAEEEIGFKIKKAEEEIGFKFRHHAIYCSSVRSNLLARLNKEHVRSLFIYATNYFDISPSLTFKSFPLLKVLDFDGFRLKRLPKSIGELIGLKYLGFRDTNLKELPSSVGSLKNLQVLDITQRLYFTKVPNVIWKMCNLRHLYMNRITLDTPLRLDTLKNLQTLVYHQRYEVLARHLIEMPNLRKLDVHIDGEVTDVREFIASLAKMKNLACVKLHLEKLKDGILEGLGTLHSIIELKLHIERTRLHRIDSFPPNLSHLTLKVIQLQEDPMPVLEKLPNLLYLNWVTGSEKFETQVHSAYKGTEIVISDGGFPKLRVLLIDSLFNLRKIKLVGEGHGILPELKRFEISDCVHLESLPNKLIALPQEFKIINCPKLNAHAGASGSSHVI